MNVERRVVAVHLDQHDFVVIVFRDQDIELEASFFVSLGASGVPADDLASASCRAFISDFEQFTFESPDCFFARM